MKRAQKYIGFSIAGLVLLVALLVVLSQTGWFRDWLRDQIVEKANRRINGRLTIDRLEGNLFTRVKLSGVLLTSRQDTLAQLSSLAVDLSPSRLFHFELRIDSIVADSPYLKLVQSPDSSWNFAGLMRADSSAAEPASGTDTSSFRVTLGDLILREGRVGIFALDTTLPDQVSQISLRASASYSDTAQRLTLSEFGFSMERPKFRLERLSFDAVRRADKITLANLVIQTAKNQFDGTGTYAPADSARSSGSLASKPFDFSELSAFMPNLTLAGNPQFEIQTGLERDSLAIQLGVIEPTQRVDLALNIANVSKLISAETRDQAAYHLAIRLTDFSLGPWLADTAVDFRANGNITLDGHGLSSEQAEVNLGAELTDVTAMNRSLGTLKASARYSGGNLAGNLDATGDCGNLATTCELTYLQGAQTFRAELTGTHINLAPLIRNDSLPTDLSFVARINGAGFQKEKVSGTCEMSVAPSRVMETSIDTASMAATFRQTAYQLDTLVVRTPIASLSASGSGSLDGRNQFTYGVHIKDLAPLHSLVGADTLVGHGDLGGELSGTLDSLDLTNTFDLQTVQFNSFSIGALTGSAKMTKAGDNLSGSARMTAHKVGSAGYSFDSLAVASQFTRSGAEVSLEAAYQPGITGHLESHIELDTPMVVSISRILLNLKGRLWSGGSPTTRVQIRQDSYQLENLSLSSPLGPGSGMQTISLGGTFSMSGAEDCTLDVKNLDLAAIATEFELATPIGGRLSVEAHLGGSAQAPKLTARLSIDSGLVNQFSYSALHAAAEYDAGKLSWTSSLVPLTGDSLSLNGFAPVNLTIAGTANGVDREKPLEITLRTTGLPLSVIKASGERIKDVDGYLTSDLKVSGTLNQPAVTGQFGLRNGRVAIPRYGIDYSDIMAQLSIHDATLTLDTLQARRDQGYVTGSGSLQFEKSLLTGTIKTTNFDFLTQKFYVLRHKDYRVQISGDAHVTGSSAEPKFGGSITVLNSSFFLPALMEEAAAAQAASQKSVPLLVAAIQRADSIRDLAGTDTLQIKRPPEVQEPDWYAALRGQFKVTIPRNTWLKSPDMNIEIGDGDIDLVKNGPNFEIFGPLKILRGQYNLYGKHFTITQGSLLFRGGAEYNPEVSMQAQYVFRTAERDKKTLKLVVSGTAFKPILQFTLDDAAIEDRDAIAYVMYGRSMDELTSGQKSDAGTAQEQLAKGAAANMLSSQLSQTLGSKLGLDVVDINSQGSLAAATVTVGKYLTNDLFMSYQRSLGQNTDPDAATPVVTLEYELKKFLFLQLLQGDEKTSGFDLIFKFQR